MTQSCTYAKKQKQSRDGDKDTSKEKHYYRLLLIINSQSLNHSSTSRDTAPQHSFKRKEKASLIDKSGRQGP